MKRLNFGLFIVPALLAAGVALAQAPAPGAGGPGGAVTAETVFTNNDTNKDGIITKEEATTAARNLIQRWDTYDLNKDGRIDMEELKKAMAVSGPPAGAAGGAPGAAPGGAPPPAAK